MTKLLSEEIQQLTNLPGVSVEALREARQAGLMDLGIQSDRAKPNVIVKYLSEIDGVVVRCPVSDCRLRH